MSYGAEFTRRASDDLAKLPPVTASAVVDGIELLAQDPVALGRPSHFPYLPGRQMYQFWVETAEGRYWVTVLFRFHPDERRIIVLDIAAQDVP